VRTFARLLGSFDAIYDLAPDLNDYAADTGSGSDFRDVRTPTPRFFMVTSLVETVVTAATTCTPEIVTTTETTVGADIPLAAAAEAAGVSEDELKIYIFWFGTPRASSFIRNKARVLGLSNDQFVDAVSLTSSDNFVVIKIPDPTVIPRLTGFFGDEAEDIVNRTPGTIGFDVDPFSIAETIRNSITKSSGGAGPSGARDFSSSAFSLLSTLDFNKTFQLDAIVPQLGGTPSNYSDLDAAVEFADGISAAVESQIAVLSTIINESQGVITSVMNDVTNLTSVVNLLFGDMENGVLGCLFGNSFNPATAFPSAGSPSVDVGIGGIGGPGTPGTPGVPTSNPIQNIINLVETQVSTVTGLINRIKSLFSDMDSISCMGSFVAGAQSLQNQFPGGVLECETEAAEAEGFELPDEFADGLGAVKVVMDLISRLFDSAISNLRTLRTTVTGLSLSIRLNVEQANFSGSSSLPTGAGCAPEQVTQLSNLLRNRSRRGFTDNTSTISDTNTSDTADI
jgi:hypothetical protein